MKPVLLFGLTILLIALQFELANCAKAKIRTRTVRKHPPVKKEKPSSASVEDLNDSRGFSRPQPQPQFRKGIGEMSGMTGHKSGNNMMGAHRSDYVNLKGYSGFESHQAHIPSNGGGHGGGEHLVTYNPFNSITKSISQFKSLLWQFLLDTYNFLTQSLQPDIPHWQQLSWKRLFHM